MAETSSRVRLVFEGSERGVVAAAAKSAAAIKGLSNENTTVGKSFAAADKQATQFIGTVTKVAAKTSLVAAAGGVVGQAFAGALPIVTALGVAGLTVKLGMDGIKKSAEQLNKPIDDLKKSVAATFQENFTPILKQVAGLIPQLTDGFQGVAGAISEAAGTVVNFAASARGVAVLNDVLEGTAAFISGLGPQLTAFLDGFLSAIASAKDQMRGLGDAFGSIFGSLGNVLRTLANDDVGTFAKAIQGFSATLTGLGKVIASVVDVAIRLGAAFGDSFGVLLTGLADGITKASPGLVDLGSALGDLFRAIAPLLPVIGELAGQFAHALADGIRAVIPYVQQFAAWAQNNVGTIKAVTEGIVALAVGVKALSIFTSVLGWVDGVVGALGRFSGSAKTAEAGVGRLSGAMGLLKTVGAAAALAAVAVALDDINVKSAGSADKLGLMEGQLHNLVGAGKELASGNISGIFADINEDLTTMVQRMQSGQSAIGQFFGYIKRQLAEKLPPLTFDVNTGPAKAQIDAFIGGVNKNSPTVNINGNTNGAAFALQEILREIAAGKSEVIIDGQPMPAQQALEFVKGLINNSNPEVQINGNPTPAGDALAGFLAKAKGSTATATLNADGKPAYETVGGWTRLAEGTTGLARLDADKAPADGKTNEWVGGVSRTRGVAKLDADPAAGNAQVAGWQGRANATTGRSKLDADPALGNAKVTGWKGTADRTTGVAKIDANASAANSVLQGLKNAWNNTVITVKAVLQKIGFANGGPVFGGFAGGGSVVGRGTGTSDSIPAMLSNGEHVLTAAEVRAAGGHAAIFALRKELMRGRVPRMSAVGGRAATGGAVSAATALPTPQVSVSVFLGDQQIRDMVRTEINTSSRATRRTVSAGAGASF